MTQPPASKAFVLSCYACGETGPMEGPLTCPNCGTPRSFQALARPSDSFMQHPPTSMWHYFSLLPIKDQRNVVTLEEGATPLIEAPRLAKRFAFSELQFKNEMANPTGSFKDRQISVGISHAKESGRDTVAVVSSGNVAAATSAYAARAGMRAVLFMHGQAGKGKIAQAGAYGATVICVDSPSPKEVFELCLEACAEHGWYHLSTAGMYEPYNVEGSKSIAYELYQRYDGDLPDWLVAPVGGGGLLGGVWRGLQDLHRMGLISSIPHLAGVQAAGCAPLKYAIDNNLSFLESLEHPWANPKTVAGGIADDIIFDGHTVLPAIRESEGVAIAVEDEAIEAGLRELAHQEGLLCELTSAVVIAALDQLPQAQGKRVCCLLTGNGIKELPYLTATSPSPLQIPPSMSALNEVIKGLE